MQGVVASTILAALLMATTPAADTAAEQENPLGKVLELMDSLTAKITKEGEAEAKAYSEFFEWCDNAASSKKFEIKTATAKKEKLEATIHKATADAEAATAKVQELVASIASDEADLKSATTVREKEAADFRANEAELVDVVSTLERALAVIQREMAKNPAAFAQVDVSNLRGLLGTLDTLADAAAFPSADKQKLLALVQSQESGALDNEELGAPAAAVYQSRSGGIVDVLEDMKDKAEQQLSDLRKAETNAKHNYEMLKQSLADQMKADNKDLEDEKAFKAEAEEAKAVATGDLSATRKDLANANAALEMASSNCMQTAADHEATVKARSEELAAIAKAKQFLADSTGGAEKQAYSMVQLSRAQTALRMRSRTDLANAEVASLVKRLAKEHHSAALAQLASRIAAIMRMGTANGQDPFAKVKGLISGLISKLEAEAGSEATEKAYCDDQMAKTKEKKGELDDDLERLTTKIDKAVAQSASLKGDVKELQAELAALAEQQAEMDKARLEGHAAFVEAKADLEEGLEGVRKALGVLRDYYGSAPAASMLQDGMGASVEALQPAMPEAHVKASGAGSSIIGILEVVSSDFAKSLAKEETEEDSAQSEYDDTTQANKVTKTLKDQDVNYKTQELKSLEKSIADLTGDKETADSELAAVREYYAKIQDRCIAKPETYEARQARRQAEIKGLKEALAILEDETAFAQRSARGLRGQHSLGL